MEWLDHAPRINDFILFKIFRKIQSPRGQKRRRARESSILFRGTNDFTLDYFFAAAKESLLIVNHRRNRLAYVRKRAAAERGWFEIWILISPRGKARQNIWVSLRPEQSICSGSKARHEIEKAPWRISPPKFERKSQFIFGTGLSVRCGARCLFAFVILWILTRQ